MGICQQVIGDRDHLLPVDRGGSGIVATQLGSELARLGHRIHFVSYEPLSVSTGSSAT